MEKNFKSLLSTICEYKLDWKRVNDVAIGNETYQIGFTDYKDATGTMATHLCLRDSKRVEYGVSEFQLAALRCADGVVTAKWLDEFKTDPNCHTFQTVAMEYLEAGKSIEDIRLKVVAQLKIRNMQSTVADIPIYNDRCYEGTAEYVKGVRALMKGKARDFYLTPEYRQTMRDLREALYSTPVKADKAIATNLVLLPVFVVC